MSETAFVTQFRRETIAAYEVGMSLMRRSVTIETVQKGNTATFLVAGSANATAVTRGVNGLIPARGNDLTQTSATLVEWHDLVEATGFNIFASQGDLRAIMQSSTVRVINRKTDSDIITELATGTVTTGAATTASMALVMKAITKLQAADVPWDGNIWAAVTPAFMAYLMQIDAFASADYVSMKPIPGYTGAWNDSQKFYDWLGVKWYVHPDLPGAGTASESTFMYHRSAIGHALNSEAIETAVGYDEKQAISWSRATAYMGSALLQNTGVVEMVHDGSAFA